MKKDVIYCMRMSRRVRETLSRIAKKDHRSVASLLYKIVADYLTKEGYLEGSEFDTERRRFPPKENYFAGQNLYESRFGGKSLSRSGPRYLHGRSISHISQRIRNDIYIHWGTSSF